VTDAATVTRAAWSWTEHVRGGGSTPWRTWAAAPADSRRGDPPVGWAPPGAAQLELARRLAAGAAATGTPTVATLTRLVDLVLSRSGPGRGLAQQPLAWPGAPDAHGDVAAAARRFGAPPVDPSDVPVGELVRLAVGTLTELLLTDPAGVVQEPPPPRRRLLTRTPAFRLDGAPVTTAAVRRGLGGSGHVEGGRSPRVVLLGVPLDEALAQVWSARVQGGAPVRWRGFLQRWSGRGDLPPAADLAVLARRWAERVGPDSVHLVVSSPEEGAAADATAATAEALALPLRAAARVPAPARPRPLTPAAVDVARRVNGVLGVRVAERRRREVVRSLVAVLDDPAGPGSPFAAGPRTLTVPGPLRDWAVDRAEQMTDDLRAAGYPVRGRLEDLAPRAEGLPTRPPRDAVLAVAVAACLRQASRDQEHRAEER
jgi:hypothetical protein